MSYRAWRVPKRGPEQTRALVALLARVYGAHPLMRWFTVTHVLEPARVPQENPIATLRAIHAFVRDRVRFVLESGEQILTPARVLLWGFGDCDDRSGLAAAMLESVRVPWRLVLLGRGPDGRLVDAAGPLPPGVSASHIWPQAFAGGRWWDLETSDSRAELGEHPAALLARVRVGF